MKTLAHDRVIIRRPTRCILQPAREPLTHAVADRIWASMIQHLKDLSR